MKVICTSLLLCLSLSFPQVCVSSVPFVDADLQEVRTMAGRVGKLYFAYFSASWCLPCQWMEQHTFQNDALGEYVQTHYLAVKLDVDEQSGYTAQQQYGINMLPSILIFNSRGVLVSRQEESLNAEQLLVVLQAHNLPRNRNIQTSSAPEPILESPRANLQIHRPPLIPETDLATTTAESAPPAYRLTTPPVTTAYPPSTVAPRSEQRYGIQVGSYSDYDNAIRQVGRLEAQFSESVRLVAKQQEQHMVYRIFLGDFADRTSAEAFLQRIKQAGVTGFVKGLE